MKACRPWWNWQLYTKFSEEAIFHSVGKVNRQRNRMITSDYGAYITLPLLLSTCLILQKTMCFVLSLTTKCTGLFSFVEQTINGLIFLDMLTEWLIPQLQQDSPNFILQLDGAPPHYHLVFRAELDNLLLKKWMGRALLELASKISGHNPVILFLSIQEKLHKTP